MVFAILAWADCIFSLQGNSQDLFAGSGIRRHASFIINAQRGAEERKKIINMVYRVTVKNSKLTGGMRVERGMSVDVVTNSMSNPVITNGGQVVADAFMRIYGIDIRQIGALNMAYLDVERIG
jgi:hypothetical protein